MCQSEPTSPLWVVEVYWRAVRFAIEPGKEGHRIYFALQAEH